MKTIDIMKYIQCLPKIVLLDVTCIENVLLSFQLPNRVRRENISIQGIQHERIYM